MTVARTCQCHLAVKSSQMRGETPQALALPFHRRSSPHEPRASSEVERRLHSRQPVAFSHSNQRSRFVREVRGAKARWAAVWVRQKLEHERRHSRGLQVSFQNGARSVFPNLHAIPSACCAQQKSTNKTTARPRSKPPHNATLASTKE
ncbi:hypothetical protein TRVL_07426 [Trypanosoma vivax]|nr:hypothetical protein TRVL_07426 [Trypanosoma vivax]